MLRHRVFMTGAANAAWLSLIAFASACSGAAEPDAQDAESTLGHAQSALTTQQQIFGFEAPLAWSASAGTIATNTTHTEGATSLSLTGASYSEISSQPLSTLTGVGTDLAIDVRPPVDASYGQLQIYAISPTLGWSYQWLGQVSLAHLPTGQFAHLSIPLSADAQQKLKQTYSDLTFRLAVSAPTASTGWLFDNLHFNGATQDCAAGSAYSLSLVNQQGVDPAMLENLRCTFYTVYPLLAQRFNPGAASSVTFSFVETANVPAWADSDNAIVYLNKAHLAANPLDSDVAVHETMHVVQAGYHGTVEGWIIEGTADYARDRYGLRNVENHWSIPTAWAPGQHFTNGYGDAAAFFKWVDAHYRQNQLPVADALDDIMRAGSYSANSWVTLTGHDVVSLWQEYSGNQAPVSASSGVTFYRDSNYSGWSFKIGTGVYGATELGSRGLQDAISSLQVPAGYRVTAYVDDGSQGSSVQFTADTSYVGDSWNDKFSTVVIEQL